MVLHNIMQILYQYIPVIDQKIHNSIRERGLGGGGRGSLEGLGWVLVFIYFVVLFSI